MLATSSRAASVSSFSNGAARQPLADMALDGRSVVLSTYKLVGMDHQAWLAGQTVSDVPAGAPALGVAGGTVGATGPAESPVRGGSAVATRSPARSPRLRAAAGGLMATQWHRVVLDEGHTIKNSRAQGSIAARALPAVCRWVESGRPCTTTSATCRA